MSLPEPLPAPAPRLSQLSSSTGARKAVKTSGFTGGAALLDLNWNVEKPRPSGSVNNGGHLGGKRTGKAS